MAGKATSRKPTANTVEEPTLDEALAEAADGGFRGPQVCEIVGITYRQLDYWARTDLVRPEVADARGSGTQRRYSYRDLVRIKVIKNLLDAGVKLQSARAAIEYLREDLGEDWATASLVLAGPDSILVRNGDDLVDVVRRGQGVLNIVSLGQVVDELGEVVVDIGDRLAEDEGSAGSPGRDSHPSRSGRAAKG